MPGITAHAGGFVPLAGHARLGHDRTHDSIHPQSRRSCPRAIPPTTAVAPLLAARFLSAIWTVAVCTMTV